MEGYICRPPLGYHLFPCLCFVVVDRFSPGLFSRPTSQSRACRKALQGWATCEACVSTGMSPQSASCCQARRPTSPPLPPTSPCRSLPSFLLTLLRSLHLPITPLFSGWRQGTCDDRGVSTGHGDPLPWLFPLAGGVDTFLPRSPSTSICSLCSRAPHSSSSRASTVRPHRALVTQVYVAGERSL